MDEVHAVRVSGRNTVTLPKAVREALELAPGVELHVRVVDGVLVAAIDPAALPAPSDAGDSSDVVEPRPIDVFAAEGRDTEEFDARRHLRDPGRLAAEVWSNVS